MFLNENWILFRVKFSRPLTQMDLLNLEKYPVPQGLMKEWDCVSNMEESLQNLDHVPLVKEQRKQGSPSGREEEHDLDGGFDSMRSASNDSTQPVSPRNSVFHPDCQKPLRAEHNIFTQASYNSSSDNSIFQQRTVSDIAFQRPLRCSLKQPFSHSLICSLR